MAESYHSPVLKEEVIEGLNLSNKELFVDGTLGGAGHSSAILERFPKIKELAFDRDTDAIEFSKVRLKSFGDRVEFFHENFREITNVLKSKKMLADGILLDLGVSSHQIDDSARGFSFRFSAPLDMRMNKFQTLSAKDVVNGYTEEKLADIIYMYGEERLSRQIAKQIVQGRPVNTTDELKLIVENCVSRYNKREVKSSIQRVFQAIRIEVNAELDGLYEFILSLAEVTKSGGRIAIITFHSLEDRIVKRAFNELSTGCICPPELPICVCGHKPKAKLINKKPITASSEEIKNNSRSTSAKLRIIEIL